MVQSLSPFKRWVINKINIFVNLLFNANSFSLESFQLFLFYLRVLFHGMQKVKSWAIWKFGHQVCPIILVVWNLLQMFKCSYWLLDISWCRIWNNTDEWSASKNFSHICFGFAKLVQKYMHSDPGVFMGWLVDSTYINPHPLEADHQANPKGYQEGVVVRVKVQCSIDFCWLYHKVKMCTFMNNSMMSIGQSQGASARGC